MKKNKQNEIAAKIINHGGDFGASSTGFINIDSLHDIPSYKTHDIPQWPDKFKSILILTLLHNENNPELDWWGDMKGGTPGNWKLIEISEKLIKLLNKKFNVQAQILPYKAVEDGIFLKEAGALAGLGIIGKNNLLITPDCGPHIRLRSLLLDIQLPSTGEIDFDPCKNCATLCFNSCPQQAFKNNSFDREKCYIQMKIDEKNKTTIDKLQGNGDSTAVIKYCRACELICPAGKK